jgi:hypothetical protein
MHHNETVPRPFVKQRFGKRRFVSRRFVKKNFVKRCFVKQLFVKISFLSKAQFVKNATKFRTNYDNGATSDCRYPICGTSNLRHLRQIAIAPMLLVAHILENVTNLN